MLYQILLVLLLSVGTSLSLSSSSSTTTTTTTRRSFSQQQLVTNWFSIATQLQNPTLYDADWAHGCYYNSDNKQLLTCRPVKCGDILSLVPIHALGIMQSSPSSPSPSSSSTIISQNKDWLVFDQDHEDAVQYYHPSAAKTTTTTNNSPKQPQPSKSKKANDKKNNNKGGFGNTTTKKQSPFPKESDNHLSRLIPFRYEIIPSPISNYDNREDNSKSQQQQNNHLPLLFGHVHPTRRPLQNGWLGHLAQQQKQKQLQGEEPQTTRTTDSNSNSNQRIVLSSPNCQIIPIAYPLCALVASMDMPDIGHPLVMATTKNTHDQADTTTTMMTMMEVCFQKYALDIQELRNYMNMAYPAGRGGLEEDDNDYYYDNHHDSNEKSQQVSSIENSSQQTEEEEDTAVFRHAFYQLPTTSSNNRDYQWEMLSHDPDIWSVPNFLTHDECDRIVQKAQDHLVPCVTKHPRTGAVQLDPSRTSRNTNLPQAEVPTIVNKLIELTNCTSAKYLEILQVLKYTRGQYFTAHTDGFSGPISACGFEQSARLVTIFCYLNDVPQGGETHFPTLNVTVKPQKGMAVLHFPTSLGYEEDFRTEHESLPAVDDKWLLVTWVWMNPRDDASEYRESNLDSLTSDLI